MKNKKNVISLRCHWVICLTLVQLVTGTLFAQTPKGSITATDVVIMQQKFSTAEYSGWTKVETDFDTKVYYPSTKTFAVKLNCSSCVNCYMTIQLKIDATGHLIASKVIKEDKCGGKFPAKMKAQWINFFGGKYEYPPIFRGKVIQVQIGKGLPC